MVFTADGRKLVTCSHNDRIVRLWDVGAGGRLLQEFDGRSAIQAFALALGDRELATAGFDGAVRLWDVATGEARWDFIEGDGPVTALAFFIEWGFPCLRGDGSDSPVPARLKSQGSSAPKGRIRLLVHSQAKFV